MKIKNIKNKVLSQYFFNQVSLFFVAQMKLFVFILFLFLAGYCFYVWYDYVYKPHWSEARKSEYAKTKNNEVTFDLDKFKIIIDKKQTREYKYQEEIKDIPDIFNLK